MEKTTWTIEKATKQVKIASGLVVIGGIVGLYMALDDFISLGANTSSFVFPYLFNIIMIILSIFQIFVGIVLKELNNWTRLAVFGIFAARIFLGYFDSWEIIAAFALLGYAAYVLRPAKAGWIFRSL
ncbi:MAG: hypothetical protein ABII88_01550 [Candidatus Omnitrophota bacterium]